MLVIDASVWVSAADATDVFSEASRAFLADVAERAEPVVLPDFAELEVACALARRLRDPERGRQLAEEMLRSPFVAVRALDSSLLRGAITAGTEKLLRAGDAVYAAVTEVVEGEVVSWDEELIRRAGAMTPEQWMEQNKPAPAGEEDCQAAEADSETEPE